MLHNWLRMLLVKVAMTSGHVVSIGRALAMMCEMDIDGLLGVHKRNLSLARSVTQLEMLESPFLELFIKPAQGVEQVNRHRHIPAKCGDPRNAGLAGTRIVEQLINEPTILRDTTEGVISQPLFDDFPIPLRIGHVDLPHLADHDGRIISLGSFYVTLQKIWPRHTIGITKDDQPFSRPSGASVSCGRPAAFCNSYILDVQGVSIRFNDGMNQILRAIIHHDNAALVIGGKLPRKSLKC